MKKIVLGCAAVLLSLGLLAGCNNKEDEPPITEAVSLSVSQTSVNLEPGGSASVTYTVDPADATVMALSDHEEYVTAVAQNGTIYLEAVAAGSAIVSVGAEYEDYASAEAQITVTVAEVLEPEPAEPVITLTGVPETLKMAVNDEASTITPVVAPEEAKVSYEITDVVFADNDEPDDEDVVISVEESEDGYVVTPAAQGTANIVFTASLEGYADATAITAVTVHEEGWTEPEPEPEPGETAPYTIRFKLTNSNGDPLTITEGINCYAVGDLWTDSDDEGNTWWDIRPDEQILVENEIDGTTYYDVVIEDYTEVPTIASWDGKIELIAYNEGETLDWDTYYTNVVYTDNIESGLTPTADGVYEIDAQLEFESWEEHFDHSNDTSFYILVVNSADEPIAWTIGRIKCQTTSWADYYAFDGENICDATTGTTSGGTYYFYNSVVGTAQPGTELYFYCSVTDNDWSVEVDTNNNSTIDVPTVDAGKVAIWVSGAEYTSGKTGIINSTADSLGGSRGTGGWITDYASIDEYLAAISW